MSNPDLPPEPPTFATERHPHLRLIIPAIVAVAFLIEQLDATVIVTALPAMAVSLGTTPIHLNLAITAYILALAMFIPLSGWLADRFGSRRIFALSLFVFALGSTLCGLASSFEMLIATRALQGLGGAMMTPVGRLILIRSFPRRRLATAMAYVTYPAIVGPLIGPLVGGFFTTYISWRWIFFINVPFALAGMVAALRYVDDVEGDPSAVFDFRGFLLVGIGFTLLQLGLENIGRGTVPPAVVAAVLIAAALLLVTFAVYARNAKAPAVDLTLFRDRAFRIATLFGGICRIGFNGLPFLLPLLLQLGFGLTPIVSGALTCVSALAAAPVRAISVAALRRWGFRISMTASAVAGSVMLASFALLEPTTPKWIIVVLTFAFGLTRATQFMSSNTLAYAEIPAARLSRATSLGAMLQQLTVSFGVSIAAILLASVAPEGARLTPENFHAVFLMSAIIPLLAVPGFFLLRPQDGDEVTGRNPPPAPPA
ncbi:MAG: DHA2 family efflux MFS transporter permease subunit [Bauldia sp.]